MTNQFNQLQEKRRSIYALGKNVKEDKQTLVDLIEKTIELSPSAFNSQTCGDCFWPRFRSNLGYRIG